jgi:CheY-like chemotaxis protein
MTNPTIRVLIADDEELIREALVALLERETDIEVVAPRQTTARPSIVPWPTGPTLRWSTCRCRGWTASASSPSAAGSSRRVRA